MPKMPGHPGGKAGQMGGKGFSADLAKNFSSLGRVIRKLFSYYPRLAPLTVFCILFSAKYKIYQFK